MMCVKYCGSSELGESVKDSFNGEDIPVGFEGRVKSLLGRERGRQKENHGQFGVG